MIKTQQNTEERFINKNMNKTTIEIQPASPGMVKLLNPYEKQVSVDDTVITEFVEDWECKLVDPDHPALYKRASNNPFKSSINWKEREEQMIQLMHANLGVGLAAPQTGSSYNMFVMNHSHLGNIGVYNPQILETENEVQIEEGCLTWPLLYIKLKRPERIRVKFTKTCGTKDVEMWMDGIDARCFLHEYDHLQGINFIDLAGDLKLRRAKQKRDKLFKKLQKRIR